LNRGDNVQKVLSVSDQLKSFEPLIRKVTNEYVRRQDNDHDDILQEARIAAISAVITYKKNKECKLSWYITQVVRNRMVDLSRKRKRIPSLKFFSDIDAQSDLALELDRATSFNPFNCVEFDLSCRKLLSEEEYKTYREYYIYGYTYDEIVANTNANVKMIKSNSKIKKDLKQCLLLIMQKLKLNEESLLYSM